MISGSNAMRMAGSTIRTVNMEISAPRAIIMHSDEIMLIFEYIPTPKVAAKNENADTITLWIDVVWAIRTASSLLFPEARSV